MAGFKLAIAPVLKWEGGYVKDPDDEGGETYRGITRKNWPFWPGWAQVDAAKPIKKGKYIPLADPFVEEFYEKHYWEPIKGDLIHDQRTAGFLLDFYVHSGYHAVEAIQTVAGVTPDGIFGPQTLAAINKAGSLFDQLKASRIAFLHAASKRKSNIKFLAGWLRRVNSFK
ncbi:glycoside hydrolase family 108 protein [Chitinophaga sp. GCM10012297]|uniref:Peptidoglycan binding protein n=1 Tax=Chitinophaga chungangae TaxID=2821488 RepID=A0ABS3YB88_9BACT|nr:glycosyl hydrolase 108 family protein [Chitinophaga chungangae]MBO9151938.1 hypothetical protein [Chitinophaga chungangae]